MTEQDVIQFLTDLKIDSFQAVILTQNIVLISVRQGVMKLDQCNSGGVKLKQEALRGRFSVPNPFVALLSCRNALIATNVKTRFRTYIALDRALTLPSVDEAL